LTHRAKRSRCSSRAGRVWVSALLILGALALAGSPAGSLAATPPGTAGAWHGTAEGIDVDFSHYTSGDVDSTSSSNYQVELSFTFSVSQSGAISGGGNGYYTDAHWHLYGNNGSSGPFDCDPPITAAPFPVEVSGHASGDQAQLSLAIPDATESNADYDCGGDYTGYSSSTHVMSESLSLVDGDDLAFSLAGPASFAAQKQTSPNSDDVTRNDVHIWTFSFTPPASTGGSPGQSGGAAAGANRPGSCDLSLSDVSAKPASATPRNAEWPERHGGCTQSAGREKRARLGWLGGKARSYGRPLPAHRDRARLRHHTQTDPRRHRQLTATGEKRVESLARSLR
jgi:hypothetical protein